MNKYLLLGTAIGVVAVSSAIWGLGYQAGYRAAADFYVREQDLQEAANREAMRLADRRYTDLVDEIENARKALADQILISDAQADSDPDALLCGISAPASVRVNAIR